LLLHGGATIHDTNTVRKHLSAIAGGRLAVAAHPAAVRALVVSDVVGDDPSVIGSGPTVGDPTTFGDAVDALRRLDLWAAVPAAVRAHLQRGRDGAAAETPGADDARLATARTLVVGRNADALEAASAAARRLGYATHVDATPCVGVAREAGAALVRRTLAYDDAAPTCRLSGGETTVVVRGRGRGGRNQELALAAAIALGSAAEAHGPLGRDVAILSGGTDGIDGPTDAAGGCVTNGTDAAMRRAGIDPVARLDDNDAHAALDAVGALVRTGPTHTNVMDVQIVLMRRGTAA
jgi:hydroxypyruvate reductase